MMCLIKSQRAILLYLVMNGPAFGRQISKRTGLSNKTVSTTPRILEKKGLVSCIITKEPRAKKVYSPTVYGLIQALTVIRPEEWPSIIKRWSDLLPLVFGKWNFFVDAGVEDLAMKGFRRAMGEAFTLALTNKTTVEPGLICSVDIFSSWFYCSHIGTYNDEERTRWAEACGNDEDIYEYLIGSLNMDILSHASEIVADEKMLDTLEDNKGKNKRKRILTKDFLRRLPLRGSLAYLSMMNHLYHRAGFSPP